jgi:hypothetical protein
MSNEKIVTALAGVLVLLPNTAALVTGLTLTPAENFVLLVLAGVGAAILKQQPGGGLSDEDVRRIAQERERIRRAEIQKVREAGEKG